MADFTTLPGRTCAQLVASDRMGSFERVAQADSVEFGHAPRADVVECAWYGTRTVTMIGEDALDRYLIMGLENRAANRPLIMLTRCFLNPGRSFANLMAFKQPWNRDTRMGIFGGNFVMRIGGGGSHAERVSDQWQIAAEVNGWLIMRFSKYTQRGDSPFYGAGPRRWPHIAGRRSPSSSSADERSLTKSTTRN